MREYLREKKNNFPCTQSDDVGVSAFLYRPESAKSKEEKGEKKGGWGVNGQWTKVSHPEVHV